MVLFLLGARDDGLGQIRGEAKKTDEEVQITTCYYRWPHTLLNDIKDKVFCYYEKELTGLIYIKGNFKKSHKKEVKKQNYTIPNTGFNYFMYLIQKKEMKNRRIGACQSNR